VIGKERGESLTEPLMVDMVSWPEKSLLRPKSIILTQLGSPLLLSMKFSGLMSLKWEAYRYRNLPVRDVVVVEVHEGAQQLLHDQRGLALGQVLAFQNEVEKLASTAVPTLVS
jgi:hypothetical protein